MSPDSLYVYCLIRSDQPREFISRGIGGLGSRVYTVGYRDLAAVVSDSPMAAYEPTRPNLLAHQSVLQEVMATFSVLPIQFGTVAPDAEAVRERLLEGRYAELQGLLRDVDGKVELILKASWHEGVIFGEILAGEPAIGRLRDALPGSSPEEAQIKRVQLGRMVETALWARRDADAQHVLAALRPIASRVQTNKISTDMMVLNAALLVERAREAELDRAVDELNREMGRWVAFQYFGPLPPYDFANVIVHLK
jgi:hypothetical protein